MCQLNAIIGRNYVQILQEWMKNYIDIPKELSTAEYSISIQSKFIHIVIVT